VTENEILGLSVVERRIAREETKGDQMTFATFVTAAESHPVTSKANERLHEDLELLTTIWRRGIAERLADARGNGERPGHRELLQVLDAQFAYARAVPAGLPDRRAALGTSVRFDDLEHDITLEYELVKPVEGDPAGGKLSVASPLGRALLGQRAGDVVEVDDAARGAIRFQLRAVSSGARGTAARSRPRGAARLLAPTESRKQVGPRRPTTPGRPERVARTGSSGWSPSITHRDAIRSRSERAAPSRSA
jgi:transcription elongation factor GreA